MNPAVAEPNRPPTRRRLRNFVIGFLVIGSILFGYFSTTLVTGVEFEPHTWQIRRFTFRADPLTKFQWTGIRHDSTVLSVDPVIAARLDQSLAAQPSRWDLATITQFGNNQPGPAEIVVRLLTHHGYTGTGKPLQFWVEWTNQDPDRATVFWQAIQRLTVFQAYAEIPGMLELALVEQDDSQFHDSLKATMSQALYRRADQCASLGDSDQAAAISEHALEYGEASAELRAFLETLENSTEDE
jgi:hypothetical protein